MMICAMPPYRRPAGRASAQPQFRLRLLTLAVLSACGSLAPAAQNQHATPLNALPTGGVVVGGSASINSSPNQMVINQTTPQATINWNSFDIGQGNAVRFNQPSSSAETMNYIGGSNPSIIQGTLSANGKVYLVNQNGILFDGSAQVNVNTLIASSLQISQGTFDNGITSSLVGKKDALGNSIPTQVATMLLNTAGQVVNYGSIRSVQVDGPSGQVVNDSSTGQPVEPGGAIMLFAPQVENHGVISANNGQVILAAGATVYLQLYNDPTVNSYNSNDLSMRGLLVKVTAAPTGALNLSQLIAAQNLNSAANIGGEIHSDRGNTTLTGMVVNQSGLVSANTAATVNGSIWLMAENYDGANTTYGTLTTGKGSVTQALPRDDGTTLAEGSAYTDNTLYNNAGIPRYQAVIKLVGDNIDHEGSAVAPGGRITVGGEYLQTGGGGTRPTGSGRVYLGSDSVLSAAGDWVDLPYSDSYLSFKLGSLDLANDSLQKGGFLINQTVTVDARLPSPLLFDIAAKISGTPQTVLEKATAGGAITVNTGEFISAPGSRVDVSGGGYDYASGMATTTWLISNGIKYNIETAPINLQYDGILTQSTPVQGYVQGSNAGLLAIDAQQMALGGSFLGGVTVGPYQRAASSLPGPGTLVLGTQSILAGSALDSSSVQDGSVANNLDTFSAAYGLSDVSFGAGVQTRQQIADALGGVEADPLNASFPNTLKNNLLLPLDMFGGTSPSSAQSSVSQGFGNLIIRAGGDISLPQGVSLNLGANGSLLWFAPQIDLAGSITAQGGSLKFNNWYDNALFGATLLESHGLLSTAGGWINDSATVPIVAAPDVIDGGPVNIGGNSTLYTGSRIDVSGGAMLSASGKLSYGSGGSITLPTIALNGVFLQAYSGGKGGALTLDAGSTDILDVGGADPNALAPSFFTMGGFTQYNLLGSSQVNFEADIHPVADRRLANPSAMFSPTGTPFAQISTVQAGAPHYLRASASLSASTGPSAHSGGLLGTDETGITVSPGVTLATDPLGSISLSSKTLMDIEGSLNAPGGKISLSLDPGSSFFYDGATGSFNALTIGGQAVLSTAGVLLPSVGPAGLTTGQVLPGGAVTIRANKNDLNMAQGALIDVSGASHAVDIPFNKAYVHANVASEGGSIVITATENAYLDGIFKGQGGDVSVAGGSFKLDLLYNGQITNLSNQNAAPSDPISVAMDLVDGKGRQLQHELIISQSPSVLPHDGSQSDSSVIGNLVDGKDDFVAPLRADISADQLVNGVDQGGIRVGGGFDSVTLSSDNLIAFNVGLDNFAPRALLRLDAPELSVANGADVQIGSVGGHPVTGQLEWFNTPADFRLSTNLPTSLVDQYPLLYTVNGSGNKVPVSDLVVQVPVPTQTGTGQLTLAANQISLAGNVTANGTENLDLVSAGDLRFEGFPVNYLAPTSAADPLPLIANLQALSGQLTSAGNITLRAGQIYPASSVNYAVAAEAVSFGQLTASFASGNGAVINAVVNRTPVGGGQITLTGDGATSLSPVLSAGGQLTLSADNIDQAGTIIAPLGTINLEGGKSVKLEPGSLTSVSAVRDNDGVATPLVIPYGATQSVGQSMWYGSIQTAVPPSKQVNISADKVTVADATSDAPAAIVDIQGGGDIAAMEFVPGIGGSRDVLAAPGTYAIIPGMAFPAADSYLDSLAPVKVSGNTAYNAVQLGAGSGLPAGRYALLPAYYALLPGAYLVQVQSGPAYANMIPGMTTTLPGGAVVVAGKLGFAGTGITQSTWSGFSIQSGADALTNSSHALGQYLVTGSSFFANDAAKNNLPAPSMPLDGGRVSIGATNSLSFLGSLLSQAGQDAGTSADGAIGQVDIYGSQFDIVGNGATAATGYASLQASDLSRMGASLMIGGKRTDTADGQSVDVVASDVIVDLNGGELKSPEMWLVATDKLSVTDGSNLAAGGTVVAHNGTLTINPDATGSQYGALLGLSAGQLSPVVRAGTLDTSSPHGNLTVAAGATLNAPGGSIAIDSTGIPQVAGLLNSDTVEIGARRIALGEAPQGSDALVVGPAQLAALGSDLNFVLHSYSSIDLYGAVDLGQAGTGSLTLDSAGLLGHDVGGSAASQLAAGQITLENLSDIALSPYGNVPGTGSLTLSADKLVLADSGSKGFTLAGFKTVNLDAGELALQGTGILTTAADLNIEAARIAAGGQQVKQQVLAYDANAQAWHPVTITQAASAPSLTDTPLPGGQLTIGGSSVDFGGNVALPSGRLTLAAHGPAASDGVILKLDTSIDLSAYQRTFAQGTANLTESAAAGRLSLSSESGSVTAQAGSSIELNGGSAGGDAGMLSIEAANGTVVLDGKLSAIASSGNQSGSASLDAANLANFSGLDQALHAGGFAQSLYLRGRSGDINVANGDTVAAHNVQLVADSGSVNVAGLIDASGQAGGGKVELDAGKDIQLTGGVLANGTGSSTGVDDAYSNGGNVGLYARNGQLEFDPGALIDVSAAAAGKSSGGEIVFSAPRTSGETNLQATLAGQVKVGGGSVNRGRRPGAPGRRRDTGRIPGLSAGGSSRESFDLCGDHQHFSGFLDHKQCLRGLQHLHEFGHRHARCRSGVAPIRCGFAQLATGSARGHRTGRQQHDGRLGLGSDQSKRMVA